MSHSHEGSEPTYDLHPAEPRWTHIALPVANIDASIAWYTDFTPLALIDRREDAHGYGAWLGMPDKTESPFILVLAEFFSNAASGVDTPMTTLAPFAHLGMELPSRESVDEVAQRGEAAGCLAMAPTMMPPPIGYITMLKDPDGNMIEFSWDQGVFATLQEKCQNS